MFSSNVTIKPYLDGQLQSNQIKIVDASAIPFVYLTFNGSGMMDLKVKIEDTVVIGYVLDFDKKSYNRYQ